MRLLEHVVRAVVIRHTLLDLPAFSLHARFDDVAIARWNAVDSNKPRLLYIPGIESSGLNLYAHAETLADTFDVRSVVVDPENEMNFEQLSAVISKYVREQGEPATLVGESFGSALALAVYQSLRHEDLIKGLVLVNSVTAFKDSHWPSKMESIVDNWGPCEMTKVIAEHSPSASELVRLVTRLVASSRRDGSTHACVHAFMLANFAAMSQDVLRHRVHNWIGAAWPDDALLESIDVPVLLVAGSKDKFLPSKSEALRLRDRIPQSEVRLLDCGHMITKPFAPLVATWHRSR